MVEEWWNTLVVISVMFLPSLIRQRVYSITLHPSQRMRETNEEFISHTHSYQSYPPLSHFPIHSHSLNHSISNHSLNHKSERFSFQLIHTHWPNVIVIGRGRVTTLLSTSSIRVLKNGSIRDNTSHPRFNNESYHFSRYDKSNRAIWFDKREEWGEWNPYSCEGSCCRMR